MTAKQMFQELGYTQTENNDIIRYVKKRYLLPLSKVIMFYPKLINYDTSDGYEQLDITPELHLAITQQMKELGWIE